MISLPPYAVRYLRQAGPIAWSGVELRSSRVDEDLARSLRVAALLEEDTAISARQARALGLDRLSDIGAFLAEWEREEAEHGLALRALLDCPGRTAPARRPKWMDLRRQGLAALPTTSLRRLPPTALVFCTLGAAGEYLAIVSYTELAKRAEDRVLESLLRAIIRQEGRHLAFFLAAARARAHVMTPLNGWLARRALAAIWQPIGLTSLGAQTWQGECGGWLDDPHYVDRIRKMDHMIDAIPHLGGLNLMASFLSDWDGRGP